MMKRRTLVKPCIHCFDRRATSSSADTDQSAIWRSDYEHRHEAWPRSHNVSCGAFSWEMQEYKR